MKTKKKVGHTPGPWKYEEFEYRVQVLKSETKAGDSWPSAGIIASCEKEIGEASYPDQALANARLIAAAPDLLAALKFLWPEFQNTNCVEDEKECDGVKHSDGCYASEIDGVGKIVRAAITKAEGQEDS